MGFSDISETLENISVFTFYRRELIFKYPLNVLLTCWDTNKRDFSYRIAGALLQFSSRLALKVSVWRRINKE